MTWGGHFSDGLHLPCPNTPISATKSTGRDGVVDMRPFRMDSSYEPSSEPKSSFDGCLMLPMPASLSRERENDGEGRGDARCTNDLAPITSMPMSSSDPDEDMRLVS